MTSVWGEQVAEIARATMKLVGAEADTFEVANASVHIEPTADQDANGWRRVEFRFDWRPTPPAGK